METSTEIEAKAAPAAVPKKRRERGTGHVWRPKYKTRDGQVRKSRTFWIQYYQHGKRYRQSANTTSKEDARTFLNNKLVEIGNGTFIGAKAESVRLEELAEDFFRDYRNNRRKSIVDARRRWTKHLHPFFGGTRAMDVRAYTIQGYIDHRMEQGPAIATINRELAVIRRMYSLGIRQEKIYRMPPVCALKENNTRTGFLDDAEYEQLVAVCDKLWLRGILAVGYTFGWRKGEILGLRVSQVDLLNRSISLNVGETKNDEGRTIKMTQEVYNLLASCVRGKKPKDYVFTRDDGSPVRFLQDDWEALFDKAKLPRKLIHDLRRSAVRNMERAGVPRSAAMKMTGHKTESIYRRYAIVSESDLAEASRKIEARRDKPQLSHGSNLAQEPNAVQ